MGTLIGPPVPGTRTNCGHEAEPVDLPESAVSALAARKEDEEGTAVPRAPARRTQGLPQHRHQSGASVTIRDPAATAATCRHRPEPTADIGVAFGAEPSVRLDGCVMTCVRGYSIAQSSFPVRNVLSAACPSLTPAPR